MEARNQASPRTGVRRQLSEAIAALAAFSALSILSRVVQPVFFLVVVAGIAFPLIWARRTRDWGALGFTRQNLGPALAWGAAGGILGLVYILVMARIDRYPQPPLLGVQLAMGIPLAFLLMAPFQEFFFRGWLQPRFENALGRWIGLLVTAVAFALWHLLPPFEGSPSTTLSMTSPQSLLTTVGMGLLFGYIFRRTRSIFAPWLAHAVWIVALVVVGALTFVQYVE